MKHLPNDRMLERIDAMVQAGRLTEDEAERLRRADPSRRDDIIREIRLRHAQAKLHTALEEGRMTQTEVEDVLDKVANGERPRFLGRLRHTGDGGRSDRGGRVPGLEGFGHD